MHRFTVGEQDDSKVTLFCRNERPAANPAVGLDGFRDRVPDGQLDPRVEDASSIRALPHVTEIRGGLQIRRVRCGCLTLQLTCKRAK